MACRGNRRSRRDPLAAGRLDRRLPREEAVRWLELAIEAVAENYAEYVDYNSTTTQSDRGEMLYTLLDFLRLQTSYNRVAWNLRPVMMAHETLVRCGCPEAAEILWQAVTRRTTEIAAGPPAAVRQSVAKYGMRLPSIAERLEERFVRPLAIDRLRALVEPAIEELRDSSRPPAEEPRATAEADEPSAFGRSEEHPRLTIDIAGAGFDLPGWWSIAAGGRSGRVAGGGRRGASRPGIADSADRLRATTCAATQGDQRPVTGLYQLNTTARSSPRRHGGHGENKGQI